MEFYRIYQIFPKRFGPLKNSGKIQFGICSRIYNFKFWGNSKLRQKGKLFIMLQTISVKIWWILDKGKVTKLNYKVWAGFGILKKELVAGPFASSPRRPIAACPGPRVHGNTPVVWSPPATSRWRGRPLATPPPCAVHAVTAPGALSRAATVQRRSQFHFLDSSR
jgi:hypothetical protein